MCCNYDNINYNYSQKFGNSYHNTSTHMTYGRENYFFIKTSGIIIHMMIFFKVMYTPISLSPMPQYFF
jgi:hypothetical protein